MEASGSYIIQFAAATLSAVFIFIMALGFRERTVLTVLILLLPFQLISSRYGSMNTMLIYLIATAFAMRGYINYRPFLMPFLAIFLVSLISITQAYRATWFDHATYLIGFVANVLVLYIFYNYVRREENWNSIWKMLIWLNIFIVIYCGIQLTVGFDRLAVFGIAEFSIIENRGDQRLVGPFHATAVTAEYLVIQVLLLAYALLNSPRLSPKLFYIGLIAANCFFLVTTGNRGGLISLIIGMLGFLYIFRREIGIIKSVAVMATIGAIFITMAGIAIQYTEFNRLFERIEETKIEGFIPDSRQRAWPMAWEAIQEKPVFGYGPRLRLIDEFNRRIPNHTPIGYPHSAYLYLLYTVGFAGLAAYAIFVLALMRRLLRATSNSFEQPLHGLPRLGLLVLFVVLISQIRIEMFRFNLFDYQNILFAISGVFVGFSDAIYAKSSLKVRRTEDQVRRIPLPGTIVSNGRTYS